MAGWLIEMKFFDVECKGRLLDGDILMTAALTDTLVRHECRVATCMAFSDLRVLADNRP